MDGPKVRHDWYQTETHVILNILQKNIDDSKLSVNFEPSTVEITYPVETNEGFSWKLNVAHEIKPSECSKKVMTSKLEVKLKKVEGLRWTKLEVDPTLETEMKQVQINAVSLNYPSSSQKVKNWDKVVTEITNGEEDKPEGEAALNELFQKIYSEGTDEVRKAMNKSFTESGGTVLSTNWGEVSPDKVDIKPPDGLEWKKWD